MYNGTKESIYLISILNIFWLNLIIIHLQLEKSSEEVFNMILVGINNDVVNLLVLQFLEDSSVGGGVGLSDVDLHIPVWGRPHQFLESDQTKLIFIKNCNSGPVQKQHHILKIAVCIIVKKLISL